jgi:hypothetical protein
MHTRLQPQWIHHTHRIAAHGMVGTQHLLPSGFLYPKDSFLQF